MVYRRDSSISVESINFRQFVRTLARFKRESKGHEHEMNTREKKLDCEYNVADLLCSWLMTLSFPPLSLSLSLSFPLPHPSTITH